jgi:hypothetical protein
MNTSSADARALVERIVASTGFQRSPRLRELLNYIADASLAEPSASLTEHETDETAHTAIVRNTKPSAGESEVYEISGEGAAVREGYAVLALLPNAAGGGHVLLLAGSDIEATEAVGTVATTESELAPVAAKIGAKDRFPPVEVLFQTRRLGGAPQEIHMIAFRRK